MCVYVCVCSISIAGVFLWARVLRCAQVGHVYSHAVQPSDCAAHANVLNVSCGIPMLSTSCLYFGVDRYYTVAFVDKRIESPEQTIADDTRIVATELSEMTLILLGAVIDGSYFTWRVAQQTSLRWASLPILCVLHLLLVWHFDCLCFLHTRPYLDLLPININIHVNANGQHSEHG